jgi:V/A-type H+-transporting ATPase subunit E
MNAEQVVEKILSDARSEAEKIKAEAQEKAAELDAAQAEELEAFGGETKRLAAEAAADRKSRMLANARMAVAKELLAAKHGLLEQVFSRASERVGQLPESDYQKLIMALMLKAVESGDEEVVIGAGESQINDKVIKEINRRLGPGFKGGLHLARDRADISSGFILRRGKVQVNVSIDVLVAQAREALEMEITTTLFGE